MPAFNKALGKSRGRCGGTSAANDHAAHLFDREPSRLGAQGQEAQLPVQPGIPWDDGPSTFAEKP
jgi:hypothetical protein